MAIPNAYQLYDFPCNTNGGSGAFDLLDEFTAPTLAAASIIGQDYATMFQKAIWLTQKYNLPSASFITFNPSASLALTPLPSGISF